MKRVLGIVFSNMHDFVVSELTAHRCMGSIPVGGRYRLIDFILSGLANSGVQSVGVITKSNYQSLMDHLGGGREWDLARKRGGIFILPPFGHADSSGMYRGRIDAYAGIMDFIRRSPKEYILSTDCEWMANFDFSGFVQNHIRTGADISLMYKKMSIDSKTRDTSTLVLDEDGNFKDMLVNPEASGVQNVYMNIMIMSRDLLVQVVNECYSRNRLSFNKDVIQAGTGKYNIQAYEYTGYAQRFDNLRSYFSANMALLDPQNRAQLFPQDYPVYTKIRDEAPVRYGLDAKVNNSLIADGCLVEGEVENSIVFRGVTVEKGAKVRNSIVMQGTVVGGGSNLDYVITDKDVTIRGDRNIVGYETYPVYISKGAAV